MTRLGWDIEIALAVMLAIGIGGCFLPHRLPDWYRVMVIGVAALIWLVLMAVPRPGRGSSAAPE